MRAWNLTEVLRVYIGVIWGSFWDNGKVRVHIGVILGLYRVYIGSIWKRKWKPPYYMVLMEAAHTSNDINIISHTRPSAGVEAEHW